MYSNKKKVTVKHNIILALIDIFTSSSTTDAWQFRFYSYETMKGFCNNLYTIERNIFFSVSAVINFLSK